MIDDGEIIELFFQRNQQAIVELDRKYGKICHSFSYNILNSHQDAEECVNDAYLGLWNTIPPARPEPLLAYVVKIVRNLSIKSYWRKEAKKRGGQFTIALQEIEGCISGCKTLDDEIETREFSRNHWGLFEHADPGKPCHFYASLLVFRQLHGDSPTGRNV